MHMHKARPENAPHVLVITGAGLTEGLPTADSQRLAQLQAAIGAAVADVLGIDQGVSVIHARNIMPAGDQEDGASQLTALGTGLRTLREEEGWSQRRLGRESGKPQSHVCNIEQGIAVRVPTVDDYLVPMRRGLMMLATEPQPVRQKPAPGYVV